MYILTTVRYYHRNKWNTDSLFTTSAIKNGVCLHLCCSSALVTMEWSYTLSLPLRATIWVFCLSFALSQPTFSHGYIVFGSSVIAIDHQRRTLFHRGKFFGFCTDGSYRCAIHPTDLQLRLFLQNTLFFELVMLKEFLLFEGAGRGGEGDGRHQCRNLMSALGILEKLQPLSHQKHFFSRTTWNRNVT